MDKGQPRFGSRRQGRVDRWKERARPALQAAGRLASAATLSVGAVAAAGDAAAEENTPRLRPLDFAPFEEALSAFPVQQIEEMEARLGSATIASIQEDMEAGRLSSEALTLFFLSRIRDHDDWLRSFVEINPAALEEARRADRLRRDGQVLGPLHGVPISVKDNIETAGPMRTTANAEILIDHVAPDDAELVARLRGGGGVILGKASLSELAGVLTNGMLLGGGGAVSGQGKSPYGPFATAGSSSGSAIATSALLTMASIGTETSGSLISPAAFNGVVAMKPSRGVVSADGVIPLISANDSAGPIARSVADAAAVLQVIGSAGTDYVSALRYDALTDVRVGVLARDILARPGNALLLQGAASSFAVAGADLRPAELGEDARQMDFFMAAVGAGVRHETIPYLRRVVPPIETPEDLVAYNADEPERRAPFGQGLLEFFTQVSAGATVEDYEALVAELGGAAASALDAAFENSDAEVLLSVENVHSSFYATAGYPAVTVPLGLRRDGPQTGMPSGLTLIGKLGEDAALLSRAFAFEQASRLRVPPQLP